jgi:FkbM family methyltransferase
VVFEIKSRLQGLAHRAGYHVSRVRKDHDCPYLEQQRLLAGTPVRSIIEAGAADGRDAERYATLFPQARVVAVEPVPDLYRQLAKRAAVTAVEAAVSDRQGTGALNIARWTDASSLLQARDTGQRYDAYNRPTHQIPVKVRTIDAIAAEHDIGSLDILKMDVQGAEMLALDGARNTLKNTRIVFTEVQFQPLYEGAALFSDLLPCLTSQGFRLHNLYGQIKDANGALAWGDALFVRA